MNTRLIAEIRSAMASSHGDQLASVREQTSRIAPLLSPNEHEQLVRDVVRDVNGLGPLQEFLDDPDVSEVMVVGGAHIWTETRSGLQHVGNISATELQLCIERITRSAGRRLDLLSPILDARLSDGSRVCIVLSPIAISGTTVAIRKFTQRILPLAAFGPPACTDIVRELVHNKTNVIISGATSSGKTSLISSISNSFEDSERVVCVEDTAELRFNHRHVVRLQTRPAGSEGGGEITLQQLVRASLRLRPDRIIVGEVRGAEVVDLLLALTSGHSGSWATVHSNGIFDTIHRLTTLILRDSPQWTIETVHDTISRAVGAIVHVGRLTQQTRGISHISTISAHHKSRTVELTSVYTHQDKTIHES